MGVVYSFETRLLPRDEQGRQCIDYTKRSTDDPVVDGVATPSHTTYCEDQAPDQVAGAVQIFQDVQKRLQKAVKRGDTASVEQLASGIFKVYTFTGNDFLGQGITFDPTKGEIVISGSSTQHYIVSDKNLMPDLFKAAEALVAQAQ